jgi:hypothetical protein
MVLPSFLIHFSEVDTHSISYNWYNMNHFLIFSWVSRESSLAMYTIYWTNLINLFNRVNHANVKKLYYLFSYLFLQLRF